MNLTREVAFAFSILTASCGGSGVMEPVLIDFYGDSITFGAYSGPGGFTGQIGYLSEPSVHRINKLFKARALGIDMSIPGIIAQEALAGGFVWKYLGPNKTMANALQSSYAKFVVLRFGTADAIRGVTPTAFEASMRALVTVIRDAGKTPVLIEPIHQTTGAAAATALRDKVILVGSSMNVQVILVRDLPYVLIDGIHPDQFTSDIMAERIVEQLLPIL